MLRQEIARIEEMIDEKLADFRLALIAEFGPPPERELPEKKKLEPAQQGPATPKKEPEKKVEEKK